MVAIPGKAEAIASDHGAILQDDIVAQSAVLAHDRMGVGKEILANARAAIDDYVRQQHGIISNLDVLVDHHVGRNVGILANSGE